MTLRILGKASSINVRKVVLTAQLLQLPFERVDAGASFGIVTEFVVRLRDMPNGGIIRSAPILWPVDQARSHHPPADRPLQPAERQQAEAAQDQAARDLAADERDHERHGEDAQPQRRG